MLVFPYYIIKLQKRHPMFFITVRLFGMRIQQKKNSERNAPEPHS